MPAPAKPLASKRAPPRTAAARMIEVEQQLANVAGQIAGIHEGMAKVCADTEEGRIILARLNDNWLTGRALGWGKLVVLGLFSTYPTWSPAVFWLVGVLFEGHFGVGE